MIRPPTVVQGKGPEDPGEGRRTFRILTGKLGLTRGREDVASRVRMQKLENGLSEGG